MPPRKLISLFFAAVIMLGLLPYATTDRSVASAQGGGGYYEGDVPVRGEFRQSLACIPGVDANNDSVCDEIPVPEPLIIDLAAYGFSPGDKVMISFKMNLYDPDYMMTRAYYLFGLFSTSNELLTEKWIYQESTPKMPMVGPLHRVPGAIKPIIGGDRTNRFGNFDNTNGASIIPGVTNDIEEDFMVWGNSYYNDWNAGGPAQPWSPDTWWWLNGFWVTIPPNAKFLFFAINRHWNVWLEGYCRVTVDKDTDGDAIPDSWEKRGVDFNKDGQIDLNLTGAYYMQKDIYVEIDYMEGHRPIPAALDDVANAFRNCPSTVDYGPINLHAEIDDSDAAAGHLHHSNVVRMWSFFDDSKKYYFGATTQRDNGNSRFTLLAKSYVYHYCLFIHGFERWNGTHWEYKGHSGLGEVNGNDFLVSLGTFTDGVGSRDEQAGAFMHELGHNMGLLHGGGDSINYKPNYLSIMNYLFIYDGDPLNGRPLTYSSAKLASLEEEHLDETEGVKNANWDWTVYSGAYTTANETRYAPLAVQTSGKIDWDNDGEDTETSVQANINNFPKWDYYNSDTETLEGFDDWSNLNFYLYENKSYSQFLYDLETHGQGSAGSEELTWEIVQAMREDAANMTGGPTGPVQVINPPVIPELPSWTLLSLLMVFTLTVTVFLRKRKNLLRIWSENRL